MKARNHFQDPNNASREKSTIYLQNLLPTREKSSSSCEPHNANPAVNIPSFITSRTPGSSKPPVPGVVVVVNTQCLNKPMLVSRRSSYQKILTLEKEGAHVVERDINMPLDLIYSAGVCLVWYDVGAIGNISRNMTDGASCIRMFMENIATDVLLSVSYSFNSYIMIFEGEANLLGAIMGHSSPLYSAAAILDINLQVLYSYNAESTDEIILTYITKFTGPTQGLYPPMPKSEKLAEYFLTKFPSINPLSAHAILSTSGTLLDFLEWSNERRIEAVGKYLVPDESVALFSALCRYVEMGESKSECSLVESNIICSLLQSPPKRNRFANEIVGLPMDDTFFSKPFQPKKSVSTTIDNFGRRKKAIISCVPSNSNEVEAGQAQFLDLAFNGKMAPPRNVFDQEEQLVSEISSSSLWSELRSKPRVRSSLPTKGQQFKGSCQKNSSSSNTLSKESWTANPSMYQGSKEAAKKIDKYPDVYPGGGKNAIDPLRPNWKDIKLKQTTIPTTEKRSPSLTPFDKRARQNLSFTSDGKDKQSRLLWRRTDSLSISTTTSLGKRSREGHFGFSTSDMMKLIVKTPGSSSLQDLLHVICQSSEISGIQERKYENTLNKIHTDKEGRLRFHLLGENGKRKRHIKTLEEKIFVLANDCLTGDPLIQDLSLSQGTTKKDITLV